MQFNCQIQLIISCQSKQFSILKKQQMASKLLKQGKGILS